MANPRIPESLTLATKVGFQPAASAIVQEAAMRAANAHVIGDPLRLYAGDRRLAQVAFLAAATMSPEPLKGEMLSMYRKLCRHDGVEPVPVI